MSILKTLKEKGGLLFQKRLVVFLFTLFLLIYTLYSSFNFQPHIFKINLLDLLGDILLAYFLLAFVIYLFLKLKKKPPKTANKKLVSLFLLSTFLIMGVLYTFDDKSSLGNLIFGFLALVWLSSIIVAFIYNSLKFLKFLLTVNLKKEALNFLKLISRLNSKEGILAVLFIGLLVIIFYSFYTFNNRLTLIENKLGGKEKLACNEREVIEKTKEATVRVVGGYTEGTGFFVKEDGTIITNYHVIEFEPAPKVILPDYRFKTAEVILGDKDADLAILKIEKEWWEKISTLTLSSERGLLEEMDKLYVVGYPLGLELSGKPTVSQGAFVTWRMVKDKPISYLQIDGSINPGASGGPVITPCGEVVGIATAGVSGLGLAISSISAQDKWESLEKAQEKPEIETIVFEPDKGPRQAVEAFYNYIKLRKLNEAYELVSKARMGEMPYGEWIEGYANTLDVSLIDIYEAEGEENKVFVKLESKDLIKQDVNFRYFEGTWQVNQEGNQYLLNNSNIKEVEDPSWEWFMTKEEKERWDKLLQPKE